jgi:hypothetical protein
MDVLFGLGVILIGGLSLVFGARIFVALLPLWGGIVGFIVGAQLMAWLLGEGFLGSVLALAVGLGAGIGFAIIANLLWWAGVVLVTGGVGFALGYAVLPALGLDWGVVSVLIGLGAAAVFAFGAVVLRVPRLLVIALMSFWGSGAVIAGLLVILDEIQPGDVGYGGVHAAVGASVAWLILYVLIGLCGVAIQLYTTSADQFTPSRTDPLDYRVYR